jgi:hypothetical protein
LTEAPGQELSNGCITKTSYFKAWIDETRRCRVLARGAGYKQVTQNARAGIPAKINEPGCGGVLRKNLFSEEAITN